jgi:FAD/FMN-containing dehydrogenase
VGQFLSWGKYPHSPQKSKSMYWPEEVSSSMQNIYDDGFKTTLAYGKGRSYGDSCLAHSDHILCMSDMDRIISFNQNTGVIHAQAGLSIDKLISIVLPRGWFIPVTPGTKYVTLGGAVANDIHGKNHHMVGTFGRYIKKIILYRSHEGVIECSSIYRPELFKATISGLGLTGIILSVEFRLEKIKSNAIDQRTESFASLDEYFELSKLHDPKNEYAVAWIDCIAKGKNFGRGHYMTGKHSKEGSLDVIEDRKLHVPFDIPFSLVNSSSLRIFNEIYFHKQFKKISYESIDYNKFFYPLDSIGHWNRIYGRNGFQQYQCVIPKSDQKTVLKNLMKEISKSNTGSFLAVLKSFGKLKSPGLISFPMEGITLALDFPQKYIEDKKLFDRLDSLVHEVGGRLYPAKDAHMSKQHFKKAYPAWIELEKIRDPRLLSKFWKRVTND